MKIRTHKATSKRVKISGNGKFLRVKSAKSHLLSHKANPTKTDLAVHRSDIRKVKKLIAGSK